MDEKKLLKLAKLARIEITPATVEKYLNLCNEDIKIIKYIFNVKVDGNKNITTNPYEIELKSYPDEVKDGNISEKLMKNAPNGKYNYFTVPKILE